MKGQRLVALSVLGFVLFNYPLLAVFNTPGSVFGVPALYAYVFAVWALLIGAIAVVAERRQT